MYCGKCGNTVEEGVRFCQVCGAELSEGGYARTEADKRSGAASGNGQGMREKSMPAYGSAGATAGLGLKEYIKKYDKSGVKGGMLAGTVLVFISAIVTIIMSAAIGTFPIDGIILAALGIWVILTYSRVPSIIVFCYSIFNLIIGLAVLHVFSGWLIIIAGIVLLVSSVKGRKNYEAYLNSSR